MGANGRKLSIDLNCEFGVPKTISDCLAEVSAIGDVSLKLSKMGCFLRALEEESRKIDAFKRELPLSMHIINLGTWFLGCFCYCWFGNLLGFDSE